MIEIGSPLTGWVTALDEVPDPVFAERMLGDGLAVDPVEGRLIAPGNGIVSSLHAAGHAITITLDTGPVLLIHIGLDTVALHGEGFAPVVKEGDRVGLGQTLIEFDLDVLARSARSLVTPVIVTNGDAFRLSSAAIPGPIDCGSGLFTLEATGAAAAAVSLDQLTVSRSLKLLLAYGLHARPAARLAKRAGEFDAQVQIVAEDGRVAPAGSPVTILGLGLGHGSEVTIKAAGPQAAEAVDALVELLESGMGELKPLAKADSSPSRTKGLSGELKGIVAVPGMAIGPAWQLRQVDIAVREEGRGIAKEREALTAGRGRLEQSLTAEVQQEHGGAIAAAHLAMVADPVLSDVAERQIMLGKSAAFAWRQAIAQFAAPLRRSNDPRFAERLDDLLDLERRLLAELDGEAEPPPLPPAGAVLLAETLYPSQLKALAEADIAGIATVAGGATSHAAIIAAGLGLPMLVGLGEGLFEITDGTPLVVRGDTLVIASDPAALDQAREEATKRQARKTAAEARAHDLAVTSDGTRIEVFANLGAVAEATLAVKQGAEGCGLLRTEFLFLDRDAPPSEEEQRLAYQQVVDALGSRPLIVRTLDIGADKPAPWLPLDPEDNPALGLRGIRLQLAQTELLETQLRALLGVASGGPLKIMLPMVTGLNEVRETKAILDRLSNEMGVVAPELGIMVETPAAALLAAILAREVAFFSIGTNDLSQYALARDRTNRAVADGLDPLDPAVLRLIDATVRGAAEHGRVTGVCGGMAAVAEAVPFLIGLGVTELSVPASAVAETKAAIRNLDIARCREVAGYALEAPDAVAVRNLVVPLLEQMA
ncbi:MAG: phosphoenolpyruvate--protein phosphotransferase [Sphingomicrobium sp.]